ncbi:phosphoribosylanthranilate isomerase [Sphingomonas sp.]|jgi:phosphoribosylanthranilate isomerase|uniref:phosphoribosylanthranilate isomerase n=1 Tax=Sphingomonas sp. TaxID=28214 RepID=UPI002E3272BA|nr:phosphoribosylanthranilate isomerase [Sphingomonas sp.]HEX4693433.1 phosphoribosylanthranilate isomerase [Sphingomonas sp.]
MSRVTAKICGLSNPETLDAAIAGGASHVGLVFFPPSPRAVSFEAAAGLAARVPSHVAKVGIFVDPCNALIDEAIEAGALDVIQLHSVTPGRAAALKQHTGLEIWVAVPIKTRSDLDSATKYEGAADKIVYDAKTPGGAALPGGMGLRFDWSVLDGFHHPLPWALSGGLTPDNVAEAARRTGATLVDVSSGVETAPGSKDVDKIAAFLQAVAQL